MVLNIFFYSYFMTKDYNMSITEHLEELVQRIGFSFIAFIFAFTIIFLNVKNIVNLLQVPAQGVKFLQLAPGEYFFTSFKITLYTGFFISSPIFVYQLIRFAAPGLTQKEKQIIIPITLGGLFLFFLGVIFGYYILLPAALSFFITYGADVIEPLWSFEQYCDFILLLLFSTGLAFEIPIVQILLSLFGIVSSKKMLGIWRYVIVLATILAAVLTPSTDPITQTLFAAAVLLLYFSGVFILVVIGK
uniref:Sec-independent periplasmic protein translocase n=1 Tax=Bangiopsis subsimplex TaxID=139980 RepID=A0A1C9CD03_9RHOD|nr:Sec-independent translocase component C [Bangiopsis subsimplex]AOM66242.1 Sec-independent translocase component C [Bangiopsis subsimplex]ARO90396.1 sec-independent periplasmic protein translocase [Bangiopsis subsimplex]